MAFPTRAQVMDEAWYPLEGSAGIKVRNLRKQHRLTQKAFAKKVKINYQTISAIENHRVNPSRYLLNCIAATFGLTRQELLDL